MPSGVKKVIPKARTAGTTIVSGRFRPNGSSAITNSLNQGKGWTATYSATGTYDMSITGKWKKCIAVVATLQGNALTAGSVLQVVGAVTLGASACTFSIVHSLNAAGTFAAADIASNANNWIHFIAVLTDTEEF